MFDPYSTVIKAFVRQCVQRYRQAFPNTHLGHEEFLEQVARMALETLLNCDCPYHDAMHTMMVADVGQTILHGRLISQGDVSPQEWVHVLVALLFHDIGYLRGLLKGDREGSYVADEADNRVTPPEGATDAYMMPFHVTRGCIFIQERYGSEPMIDVATVAGYIEMTRFPVPDDARYRRVDTLAALVRAADLIGQMGDPLYMQKLSRLFIELVESGEAHRLGYNNPGELRAGYPEFFHDQVYPYITEALKLLRKTQEGQQWTASLFHHLHNEQEKEPVRGPERARHRAARSNAAPLAEGPRIATNHGS